MTLSVNTLPNWSPFGMNWMLISLFVSAIVVVFRTWIEYQDTEYVMSFLMGLNDSLASICGQLLLMESISTRCFCLWCKKRSSMRLAILLWMALLLPLLSDLMHPSFLLKCPSQSKPRRTAQYALIMASPVTPLTNASSFMDIHQATSLVDASSAIFAYASAPISNA